MKTRLLQCIALWVVLSGAAFAQESTPDPLKEKEIEIRNELAALRTSALEAGDQLEKLSEEDREIFQMQEEEQAFSGLELLYQLSANLQEQEAAGSDTTALRAFIVERLGVVPDIVLRALDRYQNRLQKLQKEKESAGVSELGILEEQIGAVESSVDQLFDMAIRHVNELDELGIDSKEFRKQINEALQFRARLMAGRLKRHLANRSILKNRVSANSEDADLALRLEAVEVAIDNSVGSLERMVRIMENLEMDATAYKTILIQSTGDISKGFDMGVLWKFAQSGWRSLIEWIQEQLPGLLTKLLVFGVFILLFHLLAKGIQKGITRAVESSKVNVSRLLGRMIANTSYRVVLFLGILIALTQIGISLTPLLAGLGVAGFIVGFALQDTLGNFASGLMILFYRPFDEKDFVEVGGIRGWVNKMSLVSTTILTIDNKTLVVPNSKIWGDVICNLTDQETRRVDLMFGVSYDSDIPKVEGILREVLNSNDKILPDPEPQIKLHELGDSSVNFVVRPWVKTADYWEVYWYMNREVKMRFDQEGVSIPFPQRDVHHYYPDSSKPDQPPS